MGNCLVTELKSTVDDLNLQYLDGFVVRNLESTADKIVLLSLRPGTGTLLEGTWTYSSGNAVPSPHAFPSDYNQSTFMGANTSIKVVDKRTLQIFNFTNQGSGAGGLVATNMTLDFFRASVALTTLGLADTTSTGDVSCLANLTSLQTLTLYGTNISGAIESLAAAQVAKGRTSGTLQIKYGGSQITYGGQTTTNRSATKTITFSSSATGGYTIA